MLNDKQYNLTVEDIRRRSEISKPDQVHQQNSQHMIENFSKDNYEYMDGPVIGHTRRCIPNQSEEDLLSAASAKKRTLQPKTVDTMEGQTLSGKTTAKIATTDYLKGDDDEDESKNDDELMEDS